MAYDEGLAERVRTHLPPGPRTSERKMFGGLCFLVDGNMCAGVLGGELMVRVGPDRYDDALASPHARPMDFTGRPSRGIVYVGEDGISEDEDLSRWLERGLAFVSTLPPK